MDNDEVDAARSIRNSERKLCISKKSGRVWKDYMETIINEENN